MLNPWDVVDWPGLTHAHGEADDVPELLARLGEEDWDEAVDELYTALLHERCAYPATLAALPFLVQVALDPDSPGRLGALQLLDTFAGFAADSGPESLAALQRSAQELSELASDPDPEVRRAVYRSALHWPDPVGMLRERLGAEREARLDLVRPLARLGALTASDLDGFASSGQDEVLFAAAWAGFAAGHEVPGALDHLARLWSSQAKGYQGAGGGHPLSSLVQETGGRAIALLRRLMAEPAVGVGELVWAWQDALQLSRSAEEAARPALLELARREELSAEDAEDLLGALLQLLPVTPADPVAEAVTSLASRLSSAPEAQAVLAVALFAIADPHWVTPALAAVKAEEVPWVSLGGTSLEFPSALQQVRHPHRPPGLAPVAHAGIAAWPETVGAWVELLAPLPSSPEIVRLLIETPVRPAMRLLAHTARTCPAVFDTATYQAVCELPVPGGDAGAWLLVTQALLDLDPAKFARAWRMGESGEGEEELIRIWAAADSSPELHLVCLDLLARTTWGVYRSRAVQVAAIKVLLQAADAHLGTVWPVLVSLLGVPSAFEEAVSLGDRLVRSRPELRAQWLPQLENVAEENRMAAVEALQMLGELTPERALERVAGELAVVAGTRRAVEAVPAAGRVIVRVLGERPELRPVATGLLAPLIVGDERVLAPGDARTDTGLVRVLHDALTC